MSKAYLAALLRGISTEVNSLHENSRNIAEQNRTMTNLVPLKSMMSTLANGNGIAQSYKGGILDLNQNILPSDLQENMTDNLDSINIPLPINCDKAFTRYNLLEAYGSRVAFLESEQGISVFDQNRILAGVTACLTRSQEAGLTIKEGFPFVLIKGAISGIQEYIYSKIDPSEVGGTKKLSKALRGRSFYIAQLTDLIGTWLIDELNLQQANIIFSGGGQFMIIAPNTNEIADKIFTFKRRINLMMTKKFGSTMSLILATVQADQGFIQKSGSYIQIINKKLEKAKRTKHLSYLGELFELVNSTTEGNEIKGDVEFGWWLPKRDFLLEITTKKIDEVLDKFTYWEEEGNNPVVRVLKSKNGLIATFKDFDTAIFLPKTLNDAAAIINTIQPEKSKLIRLNNTNIKELISDSSFKDAKNIGFGFKWVGNYAPTFIDEENNNKYSVLPFDQLANLFEKITEDTDRRIDRAKRQFPLTIMRLDVDDLGMIFAKGMGNNNSFVSMAALSREFHLFFGGYFNKLAELHNIYITYSGGDDAFVVGSWSNIISFAENLQKDFATFVCKNQNIHFSAGIFTCNPHYPVARFAKDTAVQLDKFAKKIKGKNCIRIFGHTYTWEQFHKMLEFKDQLIECTNFAKDKEKFSQGVIYRLLQLVKMTRIGKGKEKDKEKNVNEVYKSISQLYYLFAKHGFTNKKLTENSGNVSTEVIEQLLHDFSELDTSHIENSTQSKTLKYLLPTQYVILKTREHKIKTSW